MHDENDTRLHVARWALEQALAENERSVHINWYTSTRKSDATVLAFEVTHSTMSAQREDLIGSSINDGRTLLLSIRVGEKWTIRSQVRKAL